MRGNDGFSYSQSQWLKPLGTRSFVPGGTGVVFGVQSQSINQLRIRSVVFGGSWIVFGVQSQSINQLGTRSFVPSGTGIAYRVQSQGLKPLVTKLVVPNGTIIQGTKYIAGILFRSPSGALKSCSPSGADLCNHQNAIGMTDLFPHRFNDGIDTFPRPFKGGIKPNHVFNDGISPHHFNNGISLNPFNNGIITKHDNRN